MTSPASIAFLGPEGTFTSEAARRVAPEAAPIALSGIDDVVLAVREGRADLGVVPIENAIEGSVNLTLDALAFGPGGVYVRGELLLPITLHLLAQRGVELADLKVVRSKAEALAQCRGWLSSHLPGATLEAATSTAEAARQVAQGEQAVAALGPRLAGERFGLAIAAEDVADHEGNMTRFVVLGTAVVAPTGADKTSLVVFYGDQDRPGQLLHTLDEFALRGINLTKIESRPTKRQFGQYAIFIDCEGHLADARVGEALRSVHRHVADLRVLGSYRRAEPVAPSVQFADSDTAYASAADWYAQLLSAVDL